MGIITSKNNLKKIQHTIDLHGFEHFDDSATKQGRKKLAKRDFGEKVSMKHMTPKELKAYNEGRWDGIEMRKGAHNWKPYGWPQTPHFILDPEERRTESIDEFSKLDPASERSETILYYTSTGLGYGVVAIILFITIKNLMG